MKCRVKWGNSFSEPFIIPLGTKQGGISSPGYFSLYVNDLIFLLRKSGVGCHLIKWFIGCILFADDIALISPTRAGLQKMIDICVAYCNKFCLQFNPKKSKCMVFGKNYKEYVAPVVMNSSSIEFVVEWKYLGTTLVSCKELSFSARPDLASFFRAVNSVMYVLKDAHPHVLVNLLYTNCVPILSYACSVKEYSASDMSDCNLAMNNVFRKIFGFKEWQSIRYIREYMGVKSIYEIFKTAQDKFLAKCHSHPNPIIRFLVSL